MPDNCQIFSSFSVGSTHKHGILCENIAFLFVRCLWFGFSSFEFICFSCDSIGICVDWKPAQSSVLYVVLYKCLTYNRFAILYFIRCRFFLLRFPYSNWNEYPPYFLSVWYHHNISVLYQYIQVEEIFCYPLMSIDSLMLFTNKLGW